jgi:hypothetical protein
LQPSEAIGGQGSTGTAVLTSEEGRMGTSGAALASEETRMPEPTSPTMMKILEAGPTSPGGGLHEEGDPSMDEMWHAATSADIPTLTAMTIGDGTGGAIGAAHVALNPFLTSAVGVWCSRTLPELGCRKGGHLHRRLPWRLKKFLEGLRRPPAHPHSDPVR